MNQSKVIDLIKYYFSFTKRAEHQAELRRAEYKKTDITKLEAKVTVAEKRFRYFTRISGVAKSTSLVTLISNLVIFVFGLFFHTKGNQKLGQNNQHVAIMSALFIGVLILISLLVLWLVAIKYINDLESQITVMKTVLSERKEELK
ncbi:MULTISPECIES: hypothetical protein [unclassified Leuconostoc]|uniref:hypothetical protein n=1 Tax=unclassified Leuconostoc TaxID=2685106 RepID=UPI00190632D4|nr:MULTISPECIES: hypothetical protein [unclassified Leuconostoc]MBK0040769.1 hypothetical protein [Leuconostoc sp. S51]MBK0051809.1 hypothetical protein [Leuconostoc sp. S50]